MNLINEQKNSVTVVRIGETRMMYPLLADFSGAIAQLLATGQRKVLLDFTNVTYVDSATIGCLMDLYRQTMAAGGSTEKRGTISPPTDGLWLTLLQHPIPST